MNRNQPPRIIDQPEPGYFKMRLVKKGPWVPAAIFYEECSGLWIAQIDGVLYGSDRDAHKAPKVMDIWQTAAERISEAEWAWMNAMREWAVQYDP